VGPLAVELQFALGVQPLAGGDERIAEAFSQQFIVHKVRLLLAAMLRVTRLDPTVFRERRAAAGNQRVDMSVMSHTLIPSVQHQRRRCFDAEGLREHFAERLPGAAEQQIVDWPAIAQRQGRKFVRQGEHDLQVVDAGQQQRRG